MSQVPWRTNVPALTIGQSARAVGAFVWAERRLYEIVGAWARSSGERPGDGPAIEVYFASCSQHHAWRAQMLAERLPARLVQAHRGPGLSGEPGLPGEPGLSGEPEDLVSPWTGGTAAAMEVLSGLGGDAARLAAYCRVVLARSVVGYRAWQRRCSPVCDRPVQRVLARLLEDVLDDWQEGTALLVQLLGAPAGDDALDAAAEASKSLDRLLAGGWPVAGGLGMSGGRGGGA